MNVKITKKMANRLVLILIILIVFLIVASNLRKDDVENNVETEEEVLYLSSYSDDEKINYTNLNEFDIQTIIDQYGDRAKITSNRSCNILRW